MRSCAKRDGKIDEPPRKPSITPRSVYLAKVNQRRDQPTTIAAVRSWNTSGMDYAVSYEK
jgi:hypothetical protein